MAKQNFSGPSILLAGAFLLTYTFYSWASWASDYQEAILNVEDCVMAQWMEHEDRTGDMPSPDLEAEWREECIQYFNK